MSEDPRDRRITQRVDAKLKLEARVPLPDGSTQSATLETVNISSSGVYFRSDHYIEPMTKLNIVLDLRVPAGRDAQKSGLAKVPCEGIVVRVTPEWEIPDTEHYEIAVFFTHIEPGGLAVLEEHIALLLATA